jgi:TrwC relaxase/AAA domain
VLTYRTGAAGVPGVAKSMAAHLLTETQVPEIQAKLAGYYGNGMVADSLNQSAALPRADMDPQIAKALGIDPTRALSETEVAHLLTGLRADGEQIKGKQVQASTKDRTRIAYADFTLSAPKSFSVALALAPTEAERAMLDRAHRKAAEWTMNHIAEQIGLSRKGKGGKDGYDQAHVAWIQFDHYTARPTVKVPVVENGIATTELLTVKVAGDPQRHTHFIIPNAVISKADGRVTSFFQDRIRGRVHEWGSIYQARLGVELREHGVEWELDSDTTKSMNQRMGRLTSVPRSISDLFSKRTHDGEEAARDYASRAGADWDNMSDTAKIKFMKGGTAKARRSKQDDLADYNSWLNQAAAGNYQHRSVLRPGQKQDKMSREQRLESVYATSLPILEPETERRSTFDGSLARIAAAKGFIEHGIESADEINLITRAYRTEGIRQNGEATKLIWGKANNDQFASFTTAIHVDQENEAIGLLRSAGQDRTSALSRKQIEAAIERAMKGDPKLDFTKEHGLIQRKMIHDLGSGGRATVGIGVAGSGKTTILKPLIDAWHEDGRTTFGVTLAWRQSHALADAGVGGGAQKGRQKGRRMQPDTQNLERAGIARDHSMALTGFLYRAEAGMLKLDEKTVVIIDEIAQVGTRQALELARLRARHKFQIVGLGDQMQCQSIEAGSTIRLFQKALGEGQVPELLNTVRQVTERDRETALMFRSERSAEALARKEEDGTLIIAPGGYQQAIRAGVNLLMQRRQENAANPRYSVAISAPTNGDVMAIGAEVRRRRQLAGEVGPDVVTIDASDQNKGRYSLTLAVGDRLRLFNRVKDGRGHFGDNGSVVEVVAIHPASGLTLRNEKGHVAAVNWGKLRHKETGLVQLAYGETLTIDARQGDTVHEHITVMPSGSAAVNGFKAYTSESRHRIRSWMVGSEGEEMMEIISRRPLGDPRNILDTPAQVREAVIANMARNLDRHPEKQLATDFLSKARNVREGETDSRQTAWRRREVRAPKKPKKPKKQTKAQRRHAANAAQQAPKPTSIEPNPAQAQTPAGNAASQPTPVTPPATTTLSAHAGWKLHLNVAPSTDNARTRNIAQWLADEGIHFKVGQSGGQDGKGMTVYVGGYAKARDLADELEARFVLPEAAALAEDVRWSPGVNARFDAAGDKDFHQYGVGGVPMLMRHVQDG